MRGWRFEGGDGGGLAKLDGPECGEPRNVEGHGSYILGRTMVDAGGGHQRIVLRCCRLTGVCPRVIRGRAYLRLVDHHRLDTSGWSAMQQQRNNQCGSSDNVNKVWEVLIHQERRHATVHTDHAQTSTFAFSHVTINVANKEIPEHSSIRHSFLPSKSFGSAE